jgi:hypothetical protein
VRARVLDVQSWTESLFHTWTQGKLHFENGMLIFDYCLLLLLHARSVFSQVFPGALLSLLDTHTNSQGAGRSIRPVLKPGELESMQ